MTGAEPIIHLGPVVVDVALRDAIVDGRELSFADEKAVPGSWAAAARAAGGRRVIWVGAEGPEVGISEVATVAVADRAPSDIAAEVAELDDRETL